MRKSGQWMQQLDERILELLDQDGFSTPALIAKDSRFEDLDASEARIRERCRELTERELIEPFNATSDMYELTNWGVAYLRGNLDADTLRRWA